MTCKSAAGLDSKDDIAAMSDMDDTAPKETDHTAGNKITESFEGLSTNVETLQTQAAQAVQQEEEQQDQLKKR